MRNRTKAYRQKGGKGRRARETMMKIENRTWRDKKQDKEQDRGTGQEGNRCRLRDGEGKKR